MSTLAHRDSATFAPDRDLRRGLFERMVSLPPGTGAGHVSAASENGVAAFTMCLVTGALSDAVLEHGDGDVLRHVHG